MIRGGGCKTHKCEMTLIGLSYIFLHFTFFTHVHSVQTWMIHTHIDSLCVDVVLLCGDPLCGRLEKKCWITPRSDWLGTQMCSSPDAVSTSALELSLHLNRSAAEGEGKDDKNNLFAKSHNTVFASLPISICLGSNFTVLALPNCTLMALVDALELR